jgi:type II secretory pathway component PulM
MTLRPFVARGLFLACAALAHPACAQPPTTPSADWQRQLDALRAQVSVMQKDLDEVKALLAPLRARQAPPAASVVIDLGNRPVKGAPSARLTLVELTDYQ